MNYYNLIILDRSGSMTTIRNQAVAGVNETIGTIKAFARDNSDTCQHVSLMTFCGCSKGYVYDNTDVMKAVEFTTDMYTPCCSTPLYDAIGMACSKMLALTAGDPEAKVSVTIITDGYENASQEWSHEAIGRLIKDLKNKGWLFAYIGADHDVEKVAISINISNSMTFCHDAEGTQAMFVKESCSRKSWMERVKNVCASKMPYCNDGYFNE